MRIVAPVKRVPETAGDKPLEPSSGTLDRDSVETVLNPVDEFALEEAMRLKEEHGARVTALLMGPEAAEGTLRQALSYGLDEAVRVTDDAIAGSDALGTARVLAAALAARDADLIVFGNQSTDARTCLVPAAVAELLGLPSLTYARHVEVDEGRIVVHREHGEGWDVVEARLPVVVSVVEAANDPRYPSFQGIMASQQATVPCRTLADLGVDPSEVGARGAAAVLTGFRERPPREAGTIVEDDGTGSAAVELADWMAEHRLL